MADESFTFGYDDKRGVELEFNRRSMGWLKVLKIYHW